MPTTSPIDILLEHDRWATHQILTACSRLTPEQFARQFAMGPGSLQATTTHIIGAMRIWSDILAQRPVRARLETDGTAYTVAQLLPMLNETAAEFAALARAHPLDQTVTRIRDGKQYHFTRVSVITHVATHSMHHRAQCLNMLRHLGVTPLPHSSIIEWTRDADAPQ